MQRPLTETPTQTPQRPLSTTLHRDLCQRLTGAGFRFLLIMLPILILIHVVDGKAFSETPGDQAHPVLRDARQLLLLGCEEHHGRGHERPGEWGGRPEGRHPALPTPMRRISSGSLCAQHYGPRFPLCWRSFATHPRNPFLMVFGHLCNGRPSVSKILWNLH